ncbi:TolC family protein [Azospirillaceae bacterium]
MKTSVCPTLSRSLKIRAANSKIRAANRWVGPLATAAALLLSSAPVLAAEDAALEKADYDRHAGAVVEVVYSQVQATPSARDRNKRSLLETLLKERSASNSNLKNRPISGLTLRQAVALGASEGVRKNLSLVIGNADLERMEEFIREANAVFDPVFDLSIGYNRSDTYYRARIGKVWNKNFGPSTIDNTYLTGVSVDDFASASKHMLHRVNLCALSSGYLCAYPDKLPQDPFVLAYGWAQYKGFNLEERQIVASPGRKANKGHPKQQTTYSLGLTQQLPWGGQIVLSDKTIQQKVYYDSKNYWEDGQFSTTLTGTLTMPLPFTKGSGQDNSNNIAIRRAKLAREQIDWVYKATVNQVVRDIQIVYLELARQLESLDVTVKHRDAVNKLRERMDRLYAAGQGTRYQKAQLDAEVVKADVRIEQALQAYVNASVSLAALIGDPNATRGGEIFLPYAYGQDLDRVQTFKAEEVIETAFKERPELTVDKLNRDMSELSLKLAENSARPDVKFQAALTSAEDGSTYGYQTPFHSHWAAVGTNNDSHPDSLNHNYSLTYTYPWMNHGPEASAEKARLSVEDQELAIQATQSRVRREIGDRLSALQTAQTRKRLRHDDAANMRLTYQALQRRMEAGIVSEDELTNTLRQRLDAELGEISAQIDIKQAEIYLLAAQGIISRVLPIQTAQSDVDRRRIDLLADAGYLHYFGRDKSKSSVASAKEQP